MMWKKAMTLLPTPISGLALGLASLGLCWENLASRSDGRLQLLGASLAALLLLGLVGKFICNPRLLCKELAHPVIGSVIPTFAMALMLIARALWGYHALFAEILWLFAVTLHLSFLVSFLCHRLSDFELHHLLPSWFVPPVGIIVAAVSLPSARYQELANLLLHFGLGCYVLLLPLMLYRLIFAAPVPQTALPTVAILAAPASLSLAGYLAVTAEPELIVVVPLLSVALLMTAVVYLALFKLLRLPFSPGFAAYTFPLVISATALFASAQLLQQHPILRVLGEKLWTLAQVELWIATAVVSYVACYYARFLRAQLQTLQRASV